MLVVESASNADVIRVAKLASAALPEPIDPNDLAEKAATGRASFLIAKEVATNDLVGFCVAEKDATEGHLVAFAIDKQRRGQGIGRLLMRELRADLARSGAMKVSLEVRFDDPKAQEFYRRHGFTPRGLAEHAYSDGGDALIFERPL
jgi:ribosomal-protein-alanine N-acetyltransferase